MGIVWLTNSNLVWANDFSFQLDPPEVRPGEPAILTLTLKNPVSQITEDVPPVINDDLLNDSKNIKVLERELLQENNTVRIRYKITAYDSGQYNIPPIELQLGTNSYSSEGTALKVASTRPEGDSEIRAEFGPVSEPIAWKRFLSVLFALAIFVLVLTFLKKKLPAKKIKIEPLPPEIDPLVWLREQLTLLQRDAASDTSLDRLNSLLREFYARLTKNRVKAWTTTEMKSRLLNDTHAKECIAIMVNSEEIRFARRPPSDNLIELTEKVFFK